ncbi:hypothetical protein OS493_011914 [Desmophyllum pertusum]|uniref:Uncharacterized protein n=1 Tax=Desmophyllum pertusum TaxID=174260 RepID=A0A9W9YH95_9CNID|nr:hypothetical protein OS493_011914 [Desmophyllum pertusum]
MSPSISMMEDVDKTEIYVLFLAFVIIVALISTTMVSFFYVYYQSDHLLIMHFRYQYIIIAILSLLASWASVNTCHVFAISSFTLGTFAQDTFRLIRDVQNGTLDDVIRIHEDLCTVVFNTVSAYSVWFVLHWSTYGAGFVVDTIIIYHMPKELLWETPMMMFGIFLQLVFFVYLFTLPCFCAARITNKCAGVYEKINCTTSEDWPAGHPFRDRHNIALFISYAKERRCGFKVGRITFNTSLAWLSFFFGLTALLSHFFY